MSRRRMPRLRRSPVEAALLGRDALLGLENRIRPDFKRAVGLGVLAVVCLAVGDNLGGVRRHDHLRYVVIGLTVTFAVFGATAVRSAGRETFRISVLRGGPGAASALQLVLSVIGYSLVLLGLLQLLNIDLRSLLVGGAVTGVVIGIAAQQSLSNFFAGIVLMFARPYVPGERVIVRSGGLGGPFEGEIVSAGLVYTVIETAEGRINLPNAGLLSSAVGPAPEQPSDIGEIPTADIDAPPIAPAAAVLAVQEADEGDHEEVPDLTGTVRPDTGKNRA